MIYYRYNSEDHHTTYATTMSTIHHFYRGFHITFQTSEGFYRVDHDDVPGLADHHLHLPYLNTAKRYIELLLNILEAPLPEPYNSARLEPYYSTNFRDDGPLPVFLTRTDLPPPQGRCAHVQCSLSKGSLWHYCGRPTLPGSSRCFNHSEKVHTPLPQGYHQKALVKM